MRIEEESNLIKSFDHVAVPMESVDEMLQFYSKLGFTVVQEYDGLVYAACFGDNKINFHIPELWKANNFTLRGKKALPGCGDFCFVWEGSRQALSEILYKVGAELEEGPVEREGGRNGGKTKGTSVYIRDPDSNLLEFIIYESA